MVEESVTEPPPPPDIRPYGRPSTQQQPEPARRTARHEPAIDHSSSPSRFLASTPRKTTTATTGFRLQHVLLFCAVAAIVFAPLVAAASFSPAGHTIDAPAPASGPKPKATPLLSALAFLSRQASVCVYYLTGLDPLAAVTAVGKHALGKRNVHDQPTSTTVAEAVVVPILICLSGMFAGLTLGYFSVDQTQLQVLSISGTPTQQAYARKIMPVRKNSHLLLTTLILGNMIVNEALPVVSDPLFPDAIISVVFSTAAVVIFAEIIPQSVCSRYGLLIGAKMAPVVRVMIWIALPLAWPIAKLLEYILGAHHGIVYRRSELRELIKMHAAGAAGGGDLDFDTVTMAQGALDLAGKSVKEAMTPIDKVFMLPITAKLDYETLGEVVKSGHSRIPVYQMVEVPDVDLAAPKKGPTQNKMVKKVIGSLLVKSCVLLDPEDATPLATIPINAIPSVPFDEPLTNMLNVFQEGRSHMAIVSRRAKRVENTPEDAESVMTAAAGGLRQKIMRKVATITHQTSDSDNTSSDSDTDVEKRGEKRAKKAAKEKMKAEKAERDQVPTKEAAGLQAGEQSQAEQVKQAAEADNRKRSILQQAKLTQLEQTVPADAQMPPENVEKFFEGLEGAPLGIITLEDVLEELIGEEIYDEYDDQGGPRNAASAFIPREAALAARKAALDREQALAQATPLPPTNDADIEQPRPAPTTQPSRRLIPKVPMSMFGLGKRPVSQPGKTRPQMSTTGTPLAPTPAADDPSMALDERTAEPEQMDGTTAGGTTVADDSPTKESQPVSRSNSAHMLRTHSETKISGRSSSQPGLASDLAMAPAAPVVPLTGIEPVSAVPARLLPGGVAATTAQAPPDKATSSLLSEALMIERGRRRLAASGQDPSKAMRVPSSSGVPRSVAPSRQPTPPMPSAPTLGGGPVGPGPAVIAGPPAIRSQPVGGILSPQPQAPGGAVGGMVGPGGATAGLGLGLGLGAGKKGARFKSVPTPIPTPGPRGEDPLDQAGQGRE